MTMNQSLVKTDPAGALTSERIDPQRLRANYAKFKANEMSANIDQVIGLLSDLGRSIDRLTPEMKRKAIAGLFAKKIIDTAGEIVRLEPQAWIAQAFGELVWAWRHTQPTPKARNVPIVTPTGLEPDIGISPQTAWLLERIAA